MHSQSLENAPYFTLDEFVECGIGGKRCTCLLQDESLVYGSKPTHENGVCTARRC